MTLDDEDFVAFTFAIVLVSGLIGWRVERLLRGWKYPYICTYGVWLTDMRNWQPASEHWKYQQLRHLPSKLVGY